MTMVTESDRLLTAHEDWNPCQKCMSHYCVDAVHAFRRRPAKVSGITSGLPTDRPIMERNRGKESLNAAILGRTGQVRVQ
jgi:hypothetical protein